MSEERMERKAVARAGQSKAAGTDCKKSSDVHKACPRGSKKREIPGASGKNDAPRRMVPAPRGGGGGGRGRAGSQNTALARAEGSGLAEGVHELGSVFVPGNKKKQSLNHLLNFHYSSGARERAAERPLARRPPERARAVAPHPHHRDLFLQASCQFAVKAGADYSAHLLDPDLPIPWDLVEQIVVGAEARGGDCPVCLAAPAAARVTRCGHVYCWACALHYAAVHERSPPPCPVCAAPLHVAQLKSARLRVSPTPASDEVCMRLVRRARGSAVVEPAPERGDAGRGAAAAVPAAACAAPDLPFAKMFTVTAHQVLEIIAKERQELQDQIMAEIDTSELPYLEQALQLLKEKEDNLDMTPLVLPSAPAPPAPPAPAPPAPAPPAPAPPPLLVEGVAASCARFDWFDVNDEDDPTPVEHGAPEPPGGGAGALDPNASPFVLRDDGGCEGDAEEFPLLEAEEQLPEEGGAPELTDLDRENQAKYFYFYQAEDGQHVFLHGVDVRLLCASWGALAAAPSRLRGRLLRRETFSLTHQSRKHMPCTAHLPLHCAYDVVELLLEPPFVTAAALATFAEELERRARARARSEREERRRERRAAAVAARPPAPHLASHAHFPPARPASPPPPPHPPSPAPPHPPSPAAAAALAHSPTGLSFAKMAGAGGEWRVRAPRPPSPAAAPSPAGAEGAAEGEEGAPRPALLLSDAIEAALHSAAAHAPDTAASTAHGKGARKKNKPKLLFSTGVQRAA